MINKKHKMICTTLKLYWTLLISASTVTGFISISTFTYFIGIPIGILSTAIELKICATTAG